jgi:hypothetical protein
MRGCAGVATSPVAEGKDMKTAGFYQGTADAMGVALYLYPDGSVTDLRKVGVEPTATNEPQNVGGPPRIMASVSRSDQRRSVPLTNHGDLAATLIGDQRPSRHGWLL